MFNSSGPSKINNFMPPEEQRAIFAAIDRLDAANREWDKVGLLIRSESYISFLQATTGAEKSEIESALCEYQENARFADVMRPRLATLEEMSHAGDLRFHALTLFVVTRCLRPNRFVETGVAHGKSSASILLGLHLNGSGRLKSIDLPNPPGNKLPDGALTSTGNRPVGWIVPDFLRDKWDLILGDSRNELPGLVACENRIEIFFHDSLHTYEHVRFEIETILPIMERGLIIIDNLETQAGRMFEDFCFDGVYSKFACGNLGVVVLG